jgi:heavy metal translocating P-type ATPase
MSEFLTSDEGPRAIVAELSAREGVHDVTVTPTCRSLVVKYDPDVLTETDAATLVSTIAPEVLNGQPPAQATNGHDSEAPSRLPLMVSSAAVAASLITSSAIVPLLAFSASLPIFRRAFAALRERRLNVDVLDAVASAFLGFHGRFGTAAAMTWLVSLGDYIRDATVEQSHRVIEGLFDGHIQTAWVVRKGQKLKVPGEELGEGDDIVVYAGELIPADGVVTDGKATVDQAILTGEAMPVDKDVDEAVYAGTVVREGKLYFKAHHIGRDTMASKIIRLIEQAPTRETRIQNYAEQFADRMVPWSLLGAAGSFAITGNVNAAAAFLIADYGTGIRVAAPTTVLSSLAAAARQGILIKGGGRYLEVLSEIDVIVFDKTGTLTQGIPELVEVIPHGDGVTGQHVLGAAAAAEQRLSHPFAQAIERAARSHDLTIPERENSDYIIGLGVRATVLGSEVLVGCERLMAQHGVAVDVGAEAIHTLNDGATTTVFVAVERRLVGLLVFRVPLHDEVPAVVAALRERGIRDVVMLTGDSPAAAERVAAACGIEWYIGGTLPEEKCEFVKFLQNQGHHVALVGDGVNDSPALAQADVGIAVRGGTDVASETAHVVLLEGNLWKIPQAIDIARESVRLIRQNWQLNFYPNTAAIALSLTGVMGAIGATLVSNGSAVLATLNGLRPLLGGPAKAVTPGP